MKVAFRVDASSQIGTGHFIRCLTLADTLAKKGAIIKFICRHIPENFIETLESRDYQFAQLSNTEITECDTDLKHAAWLGVKQIADAQATKDILAAESWDWLIVDHYALDVHWERVLRAKVKKILVVDDLADRQHECDVLLDQNYYADMETRYLGKVPTQCQLLLGVRYALLRDEFRQMREQIKPRSGAVKRILVFFGGVDADNYTGLAIAALAAITFSEIQIDVVIGAGHPFREQIKNSCVEHGFNCHIQTDKMAQLMAKADLAIGAGGSATWERCCLGLPALLIAFADNQIKIVKDLELLGACFYLEISKATCTAALQNEVVNLLTAQEKIKVISEKAYLLVDGLGVGRVCQKMDCSV